MKILMIVPQPFFSPRGTPFSVYYRTATLGAMGHEVDVVTYHVGRDVRIPGATIHRIPNIPFISRVKIGPSGTKLLLDVFLFWKCLAMLASGKYDAVHAHEEGVFFCLVYKKLFKNLKFIYDMHSSLPQQLRNFAFSKNRLLVGLFAWLERRAIGDAAAVITICPDLQKTVEELGAKTPSVLIENSLIDVISFSDIGDELADDLINWDRFEGKKLVLYTGTFEHYQGIPMLLESVPAVVRARPDAVFVLIGGTPAQMQKMHAEAARLGVKEHVVLTGNLHPNTVKRFLKRADVLVSPRIRGTNTPLKIYEYLASGKPIVATNLETHTQVLSEREAVLTACDAESFGRGILAALDTADSPRGSNARQLYDTAYGSTIYRTRLREVLSHVGTAV